MARVFVCESGALSDGDARKVEGASFAAIAVFNVGGDLFAVSDRCSHGNASMSEAYVEDDATVECPLHAARFCLKTGKALCQPATDPLQTFSVIEEDGQIFVEVAEASA